MPTRVFEPFRQQDSILQSTKQIVLAVAGIQSGKSTIAGVCFLSWIIDSIAERRLKGSKEKFDWLIISPTYKLLNQVTLRKFFEYMPTNFGKWKKGDSVIEVSNGDRIICLSAEDPTKIVGFTGKAAWLDEAGQYKYDAWINSQARLSVHNGRTLISTSPYGSPAAWLNRELVEPCLKGKLPYVDFIHWRSIDNPYQSKAAIDRARDTMRPEQFKRDYEGVYTKLEGLVYPDFDRETSLVIPFDIPKDWKVFAGFDYGFSCEAAIVIVAEDPKEHIFYVIDSFYKSHATTGAYQAFTKRYNITQMLYDPSAVGIINEWRTKFRKESPNFQRADNTLASGIDRLTYLIRAGKLKIFSSLADSLATEFEGYVYKGDTEKPIKKADHLCLSGDTIITTTAGSYPIKDMVGKEGWTYCYDETIRDYTVKRYSSVIKTGHRKTMRVILDDGILVLTPDHPVLKRDGTWVEASELSIGDSLMAFREYIDNHGHYTTTMTDGSRKFSHKLVWEALNGPVEDSWTNNVHHKDEDKSNNDPSNLQLVTRSEHAKIHATGRRPSLKTREKLRVAQIRRMEKPGVLARQITHLAEIRHLTKAWHRSSAGRKWHSEHAKEKKYICNIPLVCMVCEKHFMSRINRSKFCSNNCKAINGRRVRIARWGISDKKRYEMIKAGTFNHKVIDIQPGSVIDVYNMHVEDTHNFVANGVIVHNCDALRYSFSKNILSVYPGLKKRKGRDFLQRHTNEKGEFVPPPRDPINVKEYKKITDRPRHKLPQTINVTPFKQRI